MQLQGACSGGRLTLSPIPDNFDECTSCGQVTPSPSEAGQPPGLTSPPFQQRPVLPSPIVCELITISGNQHASHR